MLVAAAICNYMLQIFCKYWVKIKHHASLPPKYMKLSTTVHDFSKQVGFVALDVGLTTCKVWASGFFLRIIPERIIPVLTEHLLTFSNMMQPAGSSAEAQSSVTTKQSSVLYLEKWSRYWQAEPAEPDNRGQFLFCSLTSSRNKCRLFTDD